MLLESYSDIGKQKDPTKNIHQSDPKAQPLLDPFIKLYYFIVGVGAIPIRLLIHKKFGERSISPLALFISLGFYFWYAYWNLVEYTIFGGFLVYSSFDMEIPKLSATTSFENIAAWSLFIINGFVIYGLEVFLGNGRKVYKNIVNSFKDEPITKSTYHRGESEFFDINNYLGKEKLTIFGKQRINESKFRILIEPQNVFFYGLSLFLIFIIISTILIFNSDTFLARWFIYFSLSCSSVGLLISLSAICLFLEEFGIYSRIRDSALDLLDSEKDYKMIMDKRDELLQGNNSKNAQNNGDKPFPLVKIC